MDSSNKRESKGGYENLSRPEIEVMPEGYNQYDSTFKVIILGNSGVGKTSLTMKSVKNFSHSDVQPTVGFEFYNFSVRIDRHVAKLNIWDTCGQEVYKSMVLNFYRNSDLAVLVYAVDDMNSFLDLTHWLKELKDNLNTHARLVLVGNKSDVPLREVSSQDAEKFKIEHNFDFYFETSAKSGDNTQNLFIEIAKQLHDVYKRNSLDNVQNTNQKEDKTAFKKKRNTITVERNKRLPSKSSFVLKDKEEYKSKSCKC